MKYKLDIEECENYFEGWAFLHFHTLMPGYAFADRLNQLYDYRLARLDDMTIDGTDWPFYRYKDALGKTFFFLVERPVTANAAPWDAGDKILLVKGENAETLVQHIYADFTNNTVVDEGDLLAQEHADLLEALLTDFTVVNVLDFTSTPATRKAIKERQTVQQHCDKILAYIEQKRLDLSEEERMRLERFN